MAKQTKQPEVLQELFNALGNDLFVIAECLARPILAQSMSVLFANDQVKGSPIGKQVTVAAPTYYFPTISNSPGGCDDSWTTTSTINVPSGRTNHTVIWTGSEMIVWGGLRWQLFEQRRQI